MKHLHFGDHLGGGKHSAIKMLEMEDVRGAGCGEVWPLPIGWQHSYFYLCGSTTSSTHLLICNIPHKKNNSLNANQIMEDMWHIDALGDRVVGQPSTPFDLRIILYYGDSCGYGAVHWIPDTLRNRGTLSMSTF